MSALTVGAPLASTGVATTWTVALPLSGGEAFVSAAVTTLVINASGALYWHVSPLALLMLPLPLAAVQLNEEGWKPLGCRTGRVPWR